MPECVVLCCTVTHYASLLVTAHAHTLINTRTYVTTRVDTHNTTRYNHKGSLAYVGGDQAVMDIPRLGPIFGQGAGILWKGYETFAQISLRNQLLVANDW